MNIEELSGVGEKRKATLNSAGIFTCRDMLNYYPSRFIDLSSIEGFKADGKNRLIKVTLTEEAKVIRIRGGLNYTLAKVVDSENNKFNCVWFNQPYMKSKLRAFEDYYVYGKNSPTKKNNFVVQMMVKNSNEKLFGIYKTFDGIGQTTIKNLVASSKANEKIDSLLDDTFGYSLSDAISIVHNPSNTEELEKAKQRIEMEKAVKLVTATSVAKGITKSNKLQKYSNFDAILAKFCKKIPFSLTKSQLEAIDDLIKDFMSPYAVNRVIDGDVGSGKTMVAFFAMFVASHNNYSSAMLAPTELLATQHYSLAKKLFGDKVVLLTGSIKSTERKILLSKIKEEAGLMVFGTHALLSDKTEFNNLSLVVVDEQHRFGVGERAKIASKGITPDIISMSATPIPRTLSLILRGDADVSLIKERPFAASIQTNLVSSRKEDDMWDFLAQKINSGSKVFVVCSKIGDDEDDDILEYSAVSLYKRLKTKFTSKIDILTGKQSAEEKNRILKSFEMGETRLIVATTIVEVGIDVPDSDIMVIATPERFGLATLHQLRGRVGRNGAKAYCFCLCRNMTDKSIERLQYFSKTSDGFALADYDYNQRGAGDVFGTKQHGKGNPFGGVSLQAFKKAQTILSQLQKNTELFDKLKIESQNEFNEIFDKTILN